MVRKLNRMTVLALLLCQGCSAVPSPKPWSTTERVSAALAVACIGADVGSTVVGREEYGLKEMNPIAKNYWALGLTKVAILGIAYVVGEVSNRTRVWTTVASFNCAVATWNVYEINKEGNE